MRHAQLRGRDLHGEPQSRRLQRHQDVHGWSRPGVLGHRVVQIRDLAQQYLDSGEIPQAEQQGTETSRDVLADYARYLRDLVDLSEIRPLKVVVDAGNGMAGLTTPAVLGDAELEALP